MNAREFGCFFLGLHKYSKWVDVGTATLFNRNNFWEEERRIGKVIIQERRCDFCNIVQTRRQKY